MIKPDSLIDSDTILESADLAEGHDLYLVLSSAIKSRATFERQDHGASQSFWPARHFNLDRAAVFRDASEQERAKILDACCRDTLEEAYWIEKCGMYFASKMSLLARSAQERMLYSLFAADEAVHFNWISGYISSDKQQEMARGPFINLLDEILRSEDRLILTYIIQVILEGWGINHYHALARDCEDAGLNRIFEQIIKDEARHHASGVILFGDQQPDSNQISALVELVNRLLFMVRIGPQSVVSQIEKVKGRLSRSQKVKVFEELQTEIETTKKLETLKALIRSAACAKAILDELERGHAFRPYSASECAAFSD